MAAETSVSRKPDAAAIIPWRSLIVAVLALAVGWGGIVYAAKPPDDDHSFGHSSAEDLVALGQALLVTASAGMIGWNAVRRLAVPQELRAEAIRLLGRARATVN